MVGQFIDDLPGIFCPAFNHKSFNHCSRFEGIEFGHICEFFHILEPHFITKIRFIGPIGFHGFSVGQSQKWIGKVNILHRFEYMTGHAFHMKENFIFIHKRHFNIYLGEFGLSVCPEIFITETFHDLEITIVP